MGRTKQYPLVDCADCMHNTVCKYIDRFRRTSLPLDLETVQCTEFVPEQLVQDNVKEIMTAATNIVSSQMLDIPEDYENLVRERLDGMDTNEVFKDFVEEIGGAIVEVVNLGYGEPNVLEVNSETADRMGVAHGDHVGIGGVHLMIHVRDDMQFGLFYLVFEGEDDEE